MGGDDAHPTVAAFRSEIHSTRNLPTEVSVGQRASHLGILGLFVAFGVLSNFVLAYLILTGRIDAELAKAAEDGPAALALAKSRLSLGYGLIFPAIWMIWDFITRGGFSLKLAGLGLVRWDGRKAPRWRCAWRSLVTWMPPFALLIASAWILREIPVPAWPGWVPFWLAVALMPVYVASALISPSCGPHDRLSGLRVVPR